MNRNEYFNRLISIRNNDEFEKLALTVFRFQSEHNKVYFDYTKSLGVDVESVQSINQIPFLPVDIFKSHTVLTGDNVYARIFTSSSTTGENVSHHYIKEPAFYEQVFTYIFSTLYGDISGYNILALLPTYLEREGSSLVYMMEKLIAKTNNPASGFYLHDHEKLFLVLNRLQKQKHIFQGTKTILFGVTYALLDFVATYELSFPELIVMETGGMKGKRKEMVREEVHRKLCHGFGVKEIHSEYGMTELLSQAYSKKNGIFKSPEWMRILIRDSYDPLSYAPVNSSGGINIIDLANIDSCCFISTDDLGRVFNDRSFEVIGRMDLSEMRGCNLLL